MSRSATRSSQNSIPGLVTYRDNSLPSECAVIFFRFGAALLLVVSVALAGTALETRNLALKRSLSQQQYRMAELMEKQVALRLESQRLGTPAKLLEALERGDASLYRPPKPQRIDERRAPLLNWNPAENRSSRQRPATRK